MLDTDWTTVKSFADAGVVDLIYSEVKGEYRIMGMSGSNIIMSCSLDVDDASDFDLNYKPYANSHLSQRVINNLGPDDKTMRVIALIFTATKDSTTYHYKPLPENLYLQGGTFFSNNCEHGDWVNISIVQKGADPASDIVIDEFVTEAAVFNGMPTNIEHVAISSEIPSILSIRVKYVSTSTTEDAKACINFLTYKDKA